MKQTIAMLAAVLCAVGGQASAADGAQCRAVRALETAQRTDGWSWERGGGSAAPNVSGLVAAALTEAPDECGAETAVRQYADQCVARNQRGEFLFDPDVELLAVAGRELGEPRYLAAAEEAFARRYSGASGEETVARWRMLKRDPRLLGFDAAAAIRAAQAVGEARWAADLARAVESTDAAWNHGTDPRGWLTTSRGALLEALSRLGGFERYRETLERELLASQARDGSWEARNTQATAYAVRGLKAARTALGEKAAKRGAQWLERTQLQDGSWAMFNDGLPEPFVGEVVHEVTAEALLALK